MTLPATTVNAAISIVNGLIRLTGRVDRVMAEQTALRSDLAVLGKKLVKPPPGTKVKAALKKYLAETADEAPDPLGDRRQELADLLASNPTRAKLMDWAETYTPDQVKYVVDDPDGDFARKLASRRNAWDLEDEDIRRLAFYLDPEDDHRDGKLAWQLAMSVVEVAADLAVENQQLLFRDDRAGPIVVAVLERFASVELVNVGPGRIFLRTVLKSTLNGALDAAEMLDADKAWVDAVISALATARDESGLGEEFIVGLVQGKGYPLLVANLLEEGATQLSSDRASNFESVAADVLVAAAGIIETKPDFDDFFSEHWGDLLRAGLRSVHANGNKILDDAEPLLKNTLLATIDVLAETDDVEFLSSETLVDVVDAAIGVVATDPNALESAGDGWLGALLESTVATVASQGIRASFTDEGVEILMRTALTEFADRPELLVSNPGLPQDVVGSVLEALAESGKLRLETVAESVVESVLIGIAEKPELVGSNYPELVAELAGAFATRLDDLNLTRDEAGDILAELAEAISEDSTLVGIEPGTLRDDVLDIVLAELVQSRDKQLSGSSVRRILSSLLSMTASNSALVTGDNERLRIVVAPMLDALAGQVGDGDAEMDLRLDKVLSAGLVGVLDAIEKNPQLIETDFPKAAALTATMMKDLLDDGRLSDGQLEKLGRLTVETIAANVPLLVEDHSELAAQVLKASIAVLVAENPMRLDRDTIDAILAEVMVILSAHGKALLGGDPIDVLSGRVADVIRIGLEKAAAEIGQRIDQNAVAFTVVLLLRRWALDEGPILDIGDPLFDEMFLDIAREAMELRRLLLAS